MSYNKLFLQLFYKVSDVSIATFTMRFIILSYWSLSSEKNLLDEGNIDMEKVLFFYIGLFNSKSYCLTL